MASPAQIRLCPHFPESDRGKQALSQTVAAVHASAVIRALPVPAEEKRASLQAIIRHTQNNREQT